MPKRIVVLGPPGVGKGTQAKLLSERKRIPTISTGDLLRKSIADGTPLGNTVKEYVESGKLVPDAVITEVVEEWLDSEEAKEGFLLDGFPRTIAQAESLEQILNRQSQKLDCVLYFIAPLDVVKERLFNRAKIEGRSDDTPELIEKRFSVYRQQTEPLVEFYRSRGLLLEVDCTGSIEEVYEKVKSAICS